MSLTDFGITPVLFAVLCVVLFVPTTPDRANASSSAPGNRRAENDNSGPGNRRAARSNNGPGNPWAEHNSSGTGNRVADISDASAGESSTNVHIYCVLLTEWTSIRLAPANRTANWPQVAR